MAEPNPATEGPAVPPDQPRGTEQASERPGTARAATEPGGGTAGEERVAAEPVRAPVVEPSVPQAEDDRTEVLARNRAVPAEDAPVTEDDRTEVLARDRVVPAESDAARAEEDDRTVALPREQVAEAEPAGSRTAVLPAEEAPGAAERPLPPQPTTRIPAAEEPLPPRPANNRLVGTAWVLLAALIFEVLYLVLFALLVLIVDNASAVAPSMQQLIATPFAWLPVVLFALFYELTVLLLNRAGRFAYVLSSLIVALIVYVLSAVLILAMQDGGLGNEANLGRALIVPQVVLIPIVAREVMLWTGLAIGARGRRVRRRNRAAQEQYERERFARSVEDSRDGAGATI